MNTSIKKKELGKLRIYLKRNDKAASKNIISKIFPGKLFEEIMDAAKKDDIMNANVFSALTGFIKNGSIQQEHLEYDNAHLPLCLELIDEREKLETFFKKHHLILRDKLVVFKTVEFWEAD